ncbi:MULTISPECIES: Uma2 family endonuclease [unclassified Synechococcus]|jgi:Uma2 family endonuclease|uniref:Uma2 family endonuclease n=1 Tax=unclassified Synechococcus TaxID=2626047 RepID=UPI000C179B32|nr:MULTISPECIES: Uma2 family endonuclease [unclassified Synechococcus]
MVQVPVQPLTAEEYLRLKSWPYEGRLELEDGYIREVPTEERINTLIELFLIAELLKFLPVQRLSLGQVEVEVPAAKARFRNPDVMVLHPDHVSLLGNGRGTLRLPMPPPLLVVEVVSPGIDNEKRDYNVIIKTSAKTMLPVGSWNTGLWIPPSSRCRAGLAGNTKTRLKPALNALFPRFCPS